MTQSPHNIRIHQEPAPQAATRGRKVAGGLLALGVLAFVLVLVGALGYFWWLPSLAKGAVEDKLVGVGSKLGLEFSVGSVDVMGSSRVVIRDLAARRVDPKLSEVDDRPVLAVDEIEVNVDVLSALQGGPIESVVLTGPRAVIVRDRDGRSDLDPLVRIVDERLAATDEGKGEGASRTLPDIRVERGSMELVDRLCLGCGGQIEPEGAVAELLVSRPFPIAGLSAAQLNATFPDGGLGPGFRVRGAAKVALPDDKELRSVDFVVERNEEGAPLSASADFAPPFVLDSVPGAPHLSAKVGGVGWSGKKLSVRGLETSLASHRFFAAQEVQVEVAELSADPSALVLRKVGFVKPEVEVVFAGGTNTLRLLDTLLTAPPAESVLATAQRLVGAGSLPEPSEGGPSAGAMLRLLRKAPKSIHVEDGTLRVSRPSSSKTEAFRVDTITADVDHQLISEKITASAAFTPGEGKEVKVEGTWWYAEGKVDLSTEFDQVPVAEIVQNFGLKRGDVLKSGALSGALSVKHAPGQPWTFDGFLSAAHVSIDHPKVARIPVEDLDFRLEGKAAWYSKRGDLVVDRGAFTLEQAATVSFDGGIYGWGHGDPKAPVDLDRVAFQVSMPPTSAQAIFDAVPFALRDNLSGMRFKGQVGFSFSADIDAMNIKKMKTHSAVKLRKFDIVEYSPDTYIPKLLDGFIHEGVQPETDYEFFIEADGPGWVRIHNVSPYVIKAILTNEDGSFYTHDGFSWRQMKSALQDNFEADGYVRGASTVSMQLVKNVFLSHERTISRKLQEALLVYAMEEVVDVPKDRILEIYLNIIEWGPKVYGIRAAARHYFGRRPAQLTLSESVFLISIIPGPRKFHSYYARGEISDSWWKRIQRLLWAMKDREHITAAEYEHAMNDRPQFWYGDGLRPIEERTPVVPVVPVLEP